MDMSEFMMLYKLWRSYTGIDKLPDISEDKLLEYLTTWPHSYTFSLTDDRKTITISKPENYDKLKRSI
mgnify:CR=1 FL=1